MWLLAATRQKEEETLFIKSSMKEKEKEGRRKQKEEGRRKQEGGSRTQEAGRQEAGRRKKGLELFRVLFQPSLPFETACQRRSEENPRLIQLMLLSWLPGRVP